MLLSQTLFMKVIFYYLQYLISIFLFTNTILCTIEQNPIPKQSNRKHNMLIILWTYLIYLTLFIIFYLPFQFTILNFPHSIDHIWLITFTLPSRFLPVCFDWNEEDVRTLHLPRVAHAAQLSILRYVTKNILHSLEQEYMEHSSEHGAF